MLRFRAWDKVAKVMIYHIEQTYDGLGDFQENENIEDYVSDISFGCFADWLENDQFVIMQSTGLFDRNGKEIFEGDIVYAYSEGARLIGAIEYFDNAYCIKTKNGVYNSLWTNAEYYEIVGNVFENQELAEVE